MKYLASAIIGLIFSASAHALDINPGLWEVKSEILMNGKTYDPMAAMQTAMAYLPEDQKKMIRDKMAEQAGGFDFTGKDVKVCHTAKSLLNPKASVEKSTSCGISLETNTPTALAGTFNCKEPSMNGTFTLKVKDKSNYEYHMKGKGPGGSPMELRYKSKFVSKDCGQVKPME